MFLYGGRKPENVDKTHMDNEMHEHAQLCTDSILLYKIFLFQFNESALLDVPSSVQTSTLTFTTIYQEYIFYLNIIVIDG